MNSKSKGSVAPIEKSKFANTRNVNNLKPIVAFTMYVYLYIDLSMLNI